MNASATNSPNPPDDAASEQRAAQIRTQLLKLEHRDWWLWSLAIFVMLALTAGVVSLTYPGLIPSNDPFFQYSLNQSVRGLVALVLIFNCYSIYQQVMVKRLRRQFSEQLDAMGQLRMKTLELQRLATTDSLTNLANRRNGEERLVVELARTKRYSYPLTLVAFDLNDFKQINDKYGHAAGDLVLREFAGKLTKTIRQSDLAIRLGGDEFLALLPECRVDQASSMVARLRPLEVYFQGTRIPVEFSAGFVGYEPDDTPEKFLERADQLLYADKRARKSPPGSFSSGIRPSLKRALPKLFPSENVSRKN